MRGNAIAHLKPRETCNNVTAQTISPMKTRLFFLLGMMKQEDLPLHVSKEALLPRETLVCYIVASFPGLVLGQLRYGF
jgi:hypothetical protein